MGRLLPRTTHAPALASLAASGRLSGTRQHRLESVSAQLEDLLASENMHASLLHGHLGEHSWMARANGEGVLLDPAIYYGHREMDLAAKRLHGNAADAFWQSYESVYPLDPGSERRIAIYQLYYLMLDMLAGEEKGSQLDKLLREYSD